MDNLEVSFGGKTREGNSVTVIKNAPISAYELVRAEIERLQQLMEGFTVTCVPVRFDQLDITLTLKKGSPEKYTEVIWTIVDAIVKRTEKILAELRIDPPVKPEQEQPISTKEHSRKILRSLLPTEPFVHITVPRILGGGDSKTDMEAKKLTQTIFFNILKKLKEHFGNKIFLKISQHPSSKRGFLDVFMNINKEQIPQALKLLKEFEPIARAETEKETRGKTSFKFVPIEGEENRFELKLTPPNSTSS